jgi:hypothetical protein
MKSRSIEVGFDWPVQFARAISAFIAFLEPIPYASSPFAVGIERHSGDGQIMFSSVDHGPWS